MTRKTATLVLDDGSMFHGFSFGFDKAVAGEVVFNAGRKLRGASFLYRRERLAYLHGE